MSIILPGCRLSDKRTFTVTAPGVKNEACAQRVAQALSAVDGVDMASLRFDMAERTITLSYESLKLGKKNVEHAIAHVGFDANDVPAFAEAKAALPDACH